MGPKLQGELSRSPKAPTLRWITAGSFSSPNRCTGYSEQDPGHLAPGLDHHHLYHPDQAGVLQCRDQLPLDGEHAQDDAAHPGAGRIATGDDKQRMRQAMMEMYKTEKINPLGGCLPMLVQIPFFIALYWVLLESVECARRRGSCGSMISIKDPSSSAVDHGRVDVRAAKS